MKSYNFATPVIVSKLRKIHDDLNGIDEVISKVPYIARTELLGVFKKSGSAELSGEGRKRRKQQHLAQLKPASSVSECWFWLVGCLVNPGGFVSPPPQINRMNQPAQIACYCPEEMSESQNKAATDYLFVSSCSPTRDHIGIPTQLWHLLQVRCQGLFRPHVTCTPGWLHCPIANYASRQSQQPVNRTANQI